MATQRNNYSAGVQSQGGARSAEGAADARGVGLLLRGASHPGGPVEAAAPGGPAQLFADRRQKPDRTAEELQAQLYQQIGQLKVELDWLKKKAGLER